MSSVAVVLAAGKGTRMKSARPKVLHPFGGMPIIEHVARTALAVADRCVAVVAPDAEPVRAALAPLGVEFAEQAEQLGTGHAVRMAAPVFGGADRVLVLYGDVPLLEVATLERLVAEVPEDALGIVTVDMPDPTGLGRMVRDEAGRIARIVEEKDATEAERSITEINSGIYVIPGARLGPWLERLGADNAQGEYYLTDVVAFAVADGVDIVTVTAAYADEVAGINDRVQLARLERVLQRRRAEALMRKGVTIVDPERFDLRGTLEAGQDCEIDVGCVFIGDVRLGEGVRIGAHCVVADAIIDDGTVIAPFTHIQSARVGAGAAVGPFARLREGTDLGANAKIGNFVETKKARLGAGSKANHLAYLGDATIGEDCNIGAGTITCNYDGVAKHPTRMGDGVFVGSNSTLVAPLELGAGAYVGAGSTVTKEVPGQTLAVGRAKQRNIEGWKPPKARAADDD